ncbi:hypothetical protein LGH82_29170 [Mesorhizobium sp. PAMC28654]|uniref:hypothetical protein n=1 Tax=Mesorhizobium sp. PAMC28654 TaxID=2880934 RepID=UPI001D0A7939|nr:hypothetical protein [Mesorhizobium sp. PAMC28654]UDL89103.1 hypothetical protein LGH82_29170 [Mesorhizobium sp. PAMC28654]
MRSAAAVLAVARDFFRRMMDVLEQLALTMVAATRANKSVAFDRARGHGGDRGCRCRRPAWAQGCAHSQ